jgi:hypothetical protein
MAKNRQDSMSVLVDSDLIRQLSVRYVEIHEDVPTKKAILEEAIRFYIVNTKDTNKKKK